MHVANVTFGAYCTQQYTLMYYFYSLVLFRWSTSKHNGVNSFKFVDTYFRGLLKKCIFMDMDVRLSHAIVSICVYGDKNIHWISNFEFWSYPARNPSNFVYHLK
jgi:hypothetical protein